MHCVISYFLNVTKMSPTLLKVYCLQVPNTSNHFFSHPPTCLPSVLARHVSSIPFKNFANLAILTQLASVHVYRSTWAEVETDSRFSGFGHIAWITHTVAWGLLFVILFSARRTFVIID